MNMKHEFPQVSQEELAGLGAGHIAYLRRISGEEITNAFPSAVDIEPDASVWALFGADGTPIMLADDEGTALASALQNDLIPVAVH